jgi:hypothetical protein
MGHVRPPLPPYQKNHPLSKTTNEYSKFADMHPSATVIGTDLSPIQSTWVPPNVLFEIDDCCDDWVYRKNSFDFAHLRGLYGCIADWDKFYEQALEYDSPSPTTNPT